MRITDDIFDQVAIANKIVRVGLSIPIPDTTGKETVKHMYSLMASQCTGLEALAFKLKEAYEEIDRLEKELLARPE